MTVLHAMLDDMPGIAGQVDPEMAAALEEEFHSVVTAAVAHHRGQLLGGGIAEVGACFGVPVSDETDQERAVRCALEIADHSAPVRTRRRADRSRASVSAPGLSSRPVTRRIGCGAALPSWRRRSLARQREEE